MQMQIFLSCGFSTGMVCYQRGYPVQIMPASTTSLGPVVRWQPWLDTKLVHNELCNMVSLPWLLMSSTYHSTAIWGYGQGQSDNYIPGLVPDVLITHEYDDVTNLLRVCGNYSKIPHTGDTESLDVCGQQHRQTKILRFQMAGVMCVVSPVRCHI